MFWSVFDVWDQLQLQFSCTACMFTISMLSTHWLSNETRSVFILSSCYLFGTYVSIFQFYFFLTTWLSEIIFRMSFVHSINFDFYFFTFKVFFVYLLLWFCLVYTIILLLCLQCWFIFLHFFFFYLLDNWFLRITRFLSISLVNVFKTYFNIYCSFMVFFFFVIHLNV